jgi:hypothetical protein
MAILFIAYKVFMKMKGHRLVSDCCGRKGEVGFDVRDMPPTPPEENRSHLSVPLVEGGKPETLSVRVPEQTEHQHQKETV